MKSSAVILIVVLALTPSILMARGKSSPLYTGLKVGFINAGTALSDSPLNAGVVVGYQWGRYMSTEVEYTSSVFSGENTAGNDVDITTFSTFAVFRTRTRVRFKAKAGLTDIDGGGFSDIEFSYGVGAGIWAGGGLMELEYTVIDDGLEFLNLGVNYFF